MGGGTDKESGNEESEFELLELMVKTRTGPEDV